MSFFDQAVPTNLGVLILFFSCMLLAGAALGAQTGVIQTDELRMRAGPGLDQPIRKVLSAGDRVRVLTQGSKWLRIRHEGDVGYIYNDVQFVRLAPGSGEGAALETRADETRKHVSELKDEIASRKEEIAAYSRREEDLLDALDAAERELAQARRELREIREEKEAVGQAIAETRRRIDRLKQQVADKQEYAERRLVALYKISRIGEMNLLASAESMHELVTRRAALEKILEYDQHVVTALLEKQAQLDAMLSALDTHRSRERALEKEQQRTLRALEQKKAQREKFLAAIRNKKENRRATLRYLQEAAARLEQTLDRLERQPGRPAESGRSFPAHQGLLKMPVEGKIISGYGKYIEPRSGAPNFRNGIEIRSPRGSPVHAVFDGKAVYADWLKGYGKVIIIDHGNDYHTVYAHAEEIFLSRGDRVTAGDVIATVGDAGTLAGAALYFEIRHCGDPVNPMQWIDNS